MKDPNCPKDAVYIGRGSKYGNPFEMGVHGNRAKCCDLFESVVLPDLDVSELRGRDLKCFCKPKRCHGDSIRRKANENNLFTLNGNTRLMVS